MKLKPLIVSLSLASTCLLSANASATNTGTIHFTGSITSTTCEIQVGADGVVSPDKIVDLGSYLKSGVDADLAGATGSFGTQKSISLIPDPSTCSDPADFSSGADIQVITGSTDGVNSNVITTADTANTNVGVEFLLGGVTGVLNKGTVATSDGVNYDAATGEVQFTAQPYAIAPTVNPGPISGSATFTVAYK